MMQPISMPHQSFYWKQIESIDVFYPLEKQILPSLLPYQTPSTRISDETEYQSNTICISILFLSDPLNFTFPAPMKIY